MPLDSWSCQLASHVSASIHDDGAVLFDTDRGELFAVNRAGAAIWRGLEQRLPLTRIADALSEEYGVSSDTVHAHALLFIAELERRRLVTRRAA